MNNVQRAICLSGRFLHTKNFSTFFALTRTFAYRHLADTTEREKAMPLLCHSGGGGELA